jgi:hypothetical protein
MGSDRQGQRVSRSLCARLQKDASSLLHCPQTVDAACPETVEDDMGNPEPPREILANDPLLLTPEEAATVLRIGRTTGG